jgi:hypothetical protein
MDASVVARASDAINLALVRVVERLFLESPYKLRKLESAVRSEPRSMDPVYLEDLRWFFTTLCLAWLAVGPFGGLALVGIMLLFDGAGWRLGVDLAIGALAFLGGFTVPGAIDALWRYICVDRANKRYYEVLHADDRVHDLARRARGYRLGLVAQLTGGVVCVLLTT